MRAARGVIGVLAAGAAASAALLAAVAPWSLGGFNATVTNNAGAPGSGTLLLQEGVGSTVCISTGSGTSSSSSISTNDNSTCPISLFASTDLAPGSVPAAATVTLTNPGSLNASSLTLTPGACVAGDNTLPGGLVNTYFGTDTSGFCGKVDVAVENDTGSTPNCVFPSVTTSACPAPSSSGTLANLASATLPGLGSHASAIYKITVELDPTATNADQGLQATVPLTWTLNQ